MKSKIIAALSVFGMALGVSATAAPITYYSTLTGAQEVVAVDTKATGYGSVTLDGNLLSLSFNFNDLTSPIAKFHLHCCAAPKAAGLVAIDFETAFPAGVTTGTFNSVVNLADLNSYTTAFRTANGDTLASVQAALVNGLAAGRAYMNIHSTTFLSGEIRGQIPEPGALSLLGLGLLGFGLRRRRQD
jgi:hypothetical protein